MAIPRVIYQTFKTADLPWWKRWQISKMKKLNPSYHFAFYTDEDIMEFLQNDFGIETLKL